MRAQAEASPASRRKRHFLESCAIGAGLAALALGGPAQAQVEGSAVFVNVGAGTNVTNSPATNTTTVTVTQDQSIINWIPNDSAPTGGAIDFLPAGEIWNFVGTGDYTVLNRFVDAGGGSLARQIALNGTVNSYIGSTTGPRGGNIWFYNAGGILIGGTGVINVGSLVLTANDIDTTGGLFGAGGDMRFRGAAGQSAIRIDAGASITAGTLSPGSSYVALVAPRIVQRGTVNVDGSAALVAAEQADLRISNGLFDINVLVGADGGTVIDHSGTTSGPEQDSAGQGGIYMVAIPKNDAVTMLVSGEVGYHDASAATIDNGTVILSAGYNVSGGLVESPAGGSGSADIRISDTLFRSTTRAHATGTIQAGPQGQIPGPGDPPQPAQTGRLTVEGDASFVAGGQAALTVGSGQQIDVSGTLAIEAAGPNGIATIDMSGGQLAAGNLILSADAFGETGSAQGGTARYTQTGGDATLGGLSVSADGFGSSSGGGDGIGGSASVVVSGGTLDTGSISASAAGFGGVGQTGIDSGSPPVTPAGNGGAGIGGGATIDIGAAASVNTSLLSADASGTGGDGGAFFASFLGGPGDAGHGGDGRGGTADIIMASPNISVGDVISASANGTGGRGGDRYDSSSSGSATGVGTGGNGGVGQAGGAVIEMSALPSFSGSLGASATGNGGSGGAGNNGGAGGAALGGLAQAIVNGFDAGDLAVTLDASGTGGFGGTGTDGAGGDGGGATGGVASLEGQGAGGAVTTLQATFLSDAVGGNGGNGGLGFFANPAVAPRGGNGGAATGGVIDIGAYDGATVTLSTISTDIQLNSRGQGGSGGNGSNSGFLAGLAGGDGGAGGSGSGGTVQIGADGGGTVTSAGAAVTISAAGLSGTGGLGGTGTGANGAAGQAAATTGGRVLVHAGATGAPGQVVLGDTGIDASGDNAGRIEMRAEGTIDMASLDASALGAAAPTSVGGVAGANNGILLAAAGGTIAATGDVTLTSDAAIGVFAQGNGGVSAGGSIQVQSADRVDIQRSGGTGIAATLAAGGLLAIDAVNGLTATPGTEIGGASAVTLTVTGGAIDVDRVIGGNIDVNASGAASVEHAESGNDFTASAASFRTGLNSITTDGDIIITSPGQVDLGNSSAGGLVSVDGQSIILNSVVAGATVNLNAAGTAPGAEGIAGGSITAGGDINLAGNSIALTGPVTSDASLFAFGLGGGVAIGQAAIAGTISIFADGDLTGSYVAGGDIRLTSGSNINASAVANGGYVDSSSGLTADGNLFVDAPTGNVTLINSSAARMFGVNAGLDAAIDGATAGEDMLVLAGGTATLANASAGDDVNVNATGNITANNVAATAAGPDAATLSYSGNGFGIFASAADGADVNLVSNGAIDAGGLSAGDDIFLSAGTTIALAGATTLGLGVTGGDSSITAQGGAMTLANLNAADHIQVSSSGAVTVTAPMIAGGNIGISALSANVATIPGVNTLAAGGDLLVDVSGVISGGRYDAGGNAALTAGATIDVDAVSGGSVALAGVGGVAANSVTSAGTTGLSSSGGNIAIGTLNSVGPIDASGNAVVVGNGGNMNFANLAATGGNASVTSGGTLNVALATVTGEARLQSSGAMSVTNLTAANALLTTTAGPMTLGDVTAGTGIAANAAGSLQIGGTLAAPTIALTSSDIGIAPAGRVGLAGSGSDVTLTNANAAAQTFIGGTGTRSGYHIDAAELARLSGSRIRIIAPDVPNSSGPAAAPDAVIDDFTLTGGTPTSNLGTDGVFTIETTGKARVIGDALLTGMGDNNRFEIIGTEAVEVILGDGSIRMTGTGGAPAGRLLLAADDVTVATLAAIGDIAGATTTSAIETRLRQNDGINLSDGALYAGGIEADVRNGFYVQNSGTGTATDERRGLSFGALGLNVQTQGQPRIVANGIQIGAAGQVVGRDALALLTINGSAPASGSYDPQSLFNGCLIANPAICGFLQRPGSDPYFPVQDLIEDEIDAENPEKNRAPSAPPAPLIMMRDIDPASGEPLLDDPVTGAGNDDLWTPPAE